MQVLQRGTDHIISDSDKALVELVLDAHCDLGESPIWDARKEVLYFVDINRNSIHAFTPSDGSFLSLKLDEPVGAVALTSDPDHLLAATQRDILLIKFWGPSPGPLRSLATTPEDHGIESMRFNDGKVTPQGSFLVGRMHSGWRKGERGRLYALDPGSDALREVFVPAEVCLPNGMAWSRDGATCYFVDSGEESIVAYATDAQGVPRRNDDGTLASTQVSHRPTEHKHVPDGMCIDSDGNLWVALGESGAVVCYNSTTGEELRRVSLPVQRPTSCIFGGHNLEDLFVVTRVESGEGASEHHGGVFRVRVPGVRGMAEEPFFPLHA